MSEAQAPEPELTREEEEQIAGDLALDAAGIPQPTFTQLTKTIDRYGPDGVLESAHHLPIEQQTKLATKVRAYVAPDRPSRRRSR